MAGARSFAAIASWVADQDPSVLTALGCTRARPPSEATLRRVFTGVDADVLDAVVGTWMWTRTAARDGRRVIAIDGKTVRGARDHRDPASVGPHLVAALDHTGGTVVAQHAVADKTNEIPTARTLLTWLDTTVGLAGTVVTLDAMHTQTDTATTITGAGADYVFTIKANQKRLFAACKRLPWNKIPAATSVTTGRGRRVHRSIKVTTVPAWIDFPAATQVAQIRKTRTENGKKTVELVYVITSADHHAAPPAVLASWVQGHWAIENRLHWIRDVTYDEDRSQVRTGNGPRVMATLRNTAISLHRLTAATNIAEALRHHARRPHKIITMLTSTETTLT